MSHCDRVGRLGSDPIGREDFVPYGLQLTVRVHLLAGIQDHCAIAEDFAKLWDLRLLAGTAFWDALPKAAELDYLTRRNRVARLHGESARPDTAAARLKEDLNIALPPGRNLQRQGRRID